MRDKLGPGRRFLLLLVIASLALVGCGGDDDNAENGAPDAPESSEPAEGGSGGIQLGASDNQFSPAQLEVPSGEEITVEFSNNGENPHTFTIDGTDVDTGSVSAGESTTVTIGPLDANTPFKCNIHGATGMTGELVVE